MKARDYYSMFADEVSKAVSDMSEVTPLDPAVVARVARAQIEHPRGTVEGDAHLALYLLGALATHLALDERPLEPIKAPQKESV